MTYAITPAIIQGYLTLQLRAPGNEWYYEIVPLTFGRARIIHRDGASVCDGW